MNIKLLSSVYDVRKLEEKDIATVFHLCKSNPLYYHYCPPEVSIDGIRDDLIALPPGKNSADKHYIGFYDNNKLVAVMDLILGYPNDETAFFGFFMMDAEQQGKNIGSEIIEEVCEYLKNFYSFIRLGYVKENKQSEHFWIKNKFTLIGDKSKTDNIALMQRNL